VSLKLAGELGETELIAGVCAVSTPIDLAACVRNLGHRENAIYAWRFLNRLKERIKVRARQAPELYSDHELPNVHTVYDFDHLYTARLFGFGTADNYYATQASQNFLDRIRVPALIIQAKDDPLIPFAVYDHPSFKTNPKLRLIAPDHGGHLGFLARGPVRFWLDPVVIGWAQELVSAASLQSR
jgi:predicted alpha/beta-fold hydrolase